MYGSSIREFSSCNEILCFDHKKGRPWPTNQQNLIDRCSDTFFSKAQSHLYKHLRESLPHVALRTSGHFCPYTRIFSLCTKGLLAQGAMQIFSASLQFVIDRCVLQREILEPQVVTHRANSESRRPRPTWCVLATWFALLGLGVSSNSFLGHS